MRQILEPSALTRVPQVLPAILTYTYNYQIAAGGPHVDALVVVWSLCIEEQFYLAWPWVLRYIGARRALFLCLVAVAILTIYRTGLYLLLNWGHLGNPDPASAIWIYFATDTRIGVILIGCTAALSVRHPRSRSLWRWMRQSRWLPELTLASACVCILFVSGGVPSSASWKSATLGYTLAACTSAALIGGIFAQPHSAVAQALSWRPLVSLGRVSYGVYLFHVGIGCLALKLLKRVQWPNESVMRFIIATLFVRAVTWIVATLHYRYVERWFISLRAPTRAYPAERDV